MQLFYEHFDLRILLGLYSYYYPYYLVITVRNFNQFLK